MTIDFNQRAAIAASLDDLAADRDVPVEIDGEVWMGDHYREMTPGDASRIVVDTVLAHEYVERALAEREAYWSALKWVLTKIDKIPPGCPDGLAATIFAAADAAAWESLHPSFLED